MGREGEMLDMGKPMRKNGIGKKEALVSKSPP